MRYVNERSIWLSKSNHYEAEIQGRVEEVVAVIARSLDTRKLLVLEV